MNLLNTYISMSLLKYIKSTKYDTEMFIPIQLTDSHKDTIKIKVYNGNQYIFIPKREIIGKCKQFERNNVYAVQIKEWLHDNFYCVRYILNA